MSVASPNLSAARDQTQYKAFVRWTNTHLKKARNGPSKISDISQDLSNGVNLAKLAEVLTNQVLRYNENAPNNLIINQNISLALSAFENDGCELINIHASTIANPDELRMKMGLLWQLIQNYTISSSVDDDTVEEPVQDGAENTESKAAPKPPGGGRSQRTATRAISMVDVKNHLIEWVNNQMKLLSDDEKATITQITKTPDHTFHCTNLESNFQDGALLIAVLASLYKDDGLRQQVLDDIQKASNGVSEPCEDEERLHAALDKTMEIAQSDYDIPVLMDGRDMHLHPDANTNVTYLSYYVAVSTRQDQPKRATEQPKEEEPQPAPEPEPEPVSEPEPIEEQPTAPEPSPEAPQEATPVVPVSTLNKEIFNDELRLLNIERQHVSDASSLAKKAGTSSPVDYAAQIAALQKLVKEQYPDLANAVTQDGTDNDHNDFAQKRIDVHVERLQALIALLQTSQANSVKPVEPTKTATDTATKPSQTTTQPPQQDLNLYLIIALVIAVLAFLVK